MAEQMGRNAKEPVGSKPEAKEQPKETDRRRDPARKVPGEVIQVAGSHSGISGSERERLHAQLWMLYKDSEETS